MRTESDHFPMICKVNCDLCVNLRSDTVTSASSVTNSAIFAINGFQKLRKNLKRNSRMNLLSVKLTKCLIRYQPMLVGVR